MELPHFDILHREARAQRHANAVTGVDMGVGSRGVNAPGAARGKDRGLGFDVHDFAGFHADGDYPDHRAVLVLDQVSGVPLVKKHRVVLHVALVQGVQQGVAGAVRRGTGARGLAALTVILGLAAEGALVDAALFRAGERQAHVLQFEHGLGADTAHVLDGVLVTDVIGALHGVIHMPAPVIVGVGAGDGAGDPALGRYRV